jgi:hypothetical protein
MASVFRSDTPGSRIKPTFIQHAANILGDTDKGLTGAHIVRAFATYAVEYDIHIPHPTYPFEAPNKRTALYENLMAFNPSQQYRIIKELCDHRSLGSDENPELQRLKIQLVTRYAHLNTESPATEINETIVEETKHWLQSYPDSLSIYVQALDKYESGVFHRNLLDDLRLSLEKLLKAIFSNGKSLENQVSSVGIYIKDKGGSTELSNMFVKLLDYYTKYHNTYVKHDDAVIDEEIEFVFEITSSFMKHLIRLTTRAP